EAFSGSAVRYLSSPKVSVLTCSFPVRADSLGPGIVLSCTGPKSRTRRPPQRPITAPNRPTTVSITHDCGERTDTGRVAIFGNLSLGGQVEQALSPSCGQSVRFLGPRGVSPDRVSLPRPCRPCSSGSGRRRVGHARRR